MDIRAESINSVFLRWKTDKASNGHDYAPVYARISPNIETVLEIGVSAGRSIASWLEIFPKAQIYGIDQSPLNDNYHLLANPRVNLIYCDIHRLDVTSLPMFDLIIDDASHEARAIVVGWQILQNKLKGTYIVEDVTKEAVNPILDAAYKYSPEIIETGNGGGDNRIILWNKGS